MGDQDLSTVAGSFPRRTLAGGLSALAAVTILSACSSTPPAKEPTGDELAPPAKQAEAGAEAKGAKTEDGPKLQAPPDDKPAGGGGALEELVREQSLRSQEKLALSEHYTRVGERFYQQFRWEEAISNLQKAVDANPDNTKARYLLKMAMLLSGDSKGAADGSSDKLGEEREAKIQQERIELQRLFDSGKGLYDEEKYDLAIRKFEQVLERVKWSPYKIDPNGLEEEARKLIIQARAQKRESDLRRREELEERARQIALQEESRAQEARDQKVRLLLTRAMNDMRLNRYDEAIDTLNEVLESDPENQQAEKLMTLANEGKHVHTQREIIANDGEESRRNVENQRENVVPYLPRNGVMFPEKEDWDLVKKRGVGVAPPEAEEPAWVLDFKKVLRTRKITINFTDTPFSDVINFLQDITGLNITVSREIDQEELRVNLRLRDIVLQNAMDLLLQQTNLAMTFQLETIKIVPKEEARGNYYLDILDIQDLLSRVPDFPGPRIEVTGDSSGGGGGGGAGGGSALNFGDDDDEGEGSVLDPDRLQELVINSTGEDRWEDPASIEIHRGQIIVFQTPEMHKQVRDVLENLRKNSGLFVQIETRFVSLFNDFLRDIGVDYRDLGQSNSSVLGAPVFGGAPNLNPSPTNFPRNPNPQNINANVIGIGRAFNGRASQFGLNNPATGQPVFGTSYLGGRVENIVDGAQGGYLAGMRLNGTNVQATAIDKGATLQASILDPIQINAILKLDEERAKTRTVQAPVVTAANRQRVHISIVTQRAYISDYELSSGGTGLVVAEVADPVIQTFQEGVVLDVRPTISHDRKYITLDVRPTLAILVGGDFGRIPVNLGTQTRAAINVNIEVPQVLLQEAFTSVTVPDGGTALLGGLRVINEQEFKSGLPVLMELPVINTLFSRKSELRESQSLMVLLKAKMISLREEESRLFNTD